MFILCRNIDFIPMVIDLRACFRKSEIVKYDYNFRHCSSYSYIQEAASVSVMRCKGRKIPTHLGPFDLFTSSDVREENFLLSWDRYKS
jgi:hypothetical protein